MDWPSLVVGALLGLATNLVTPSVQRALRSLVGWSGAGVVRLSERRLRIRLLELQEDLALVERLRANPSELVARVAADLVTLGLVTWLVLVVGFFAFVQPGGTVVIPKVWWGALGGVFGASSRYAIAAISTSNLASRVARFEAFVVQNRKRQEQILALLPSGRTGG